VSHAAAAAPDNFHIPSRSRLGEKRLTAFRGRDAAFGNQVPMLALRTWCQPGRPLAASRALALRSATFEPRSED
jgi:hypothetical protein